jgi:hypothetical protein
MRSYRVNYSTTMLTVAFALIILSAAVAGAQGRLPGPASRERNRAMDEYDRQINLMKNDARAAKERRKNLFPQINEDFQRIQVLHNELVRMVQSEKGLEYGRLTAVTSEMKSRANRLRTNLALPEPEGLKETTVPTHNQVTHNEEETPSDTHVKGSVFDLHDAIVSFVSSPIFKNLGVLDAKVVDKASDDLKDIVELCESIRKSAEVLSKTAKK